MPTKRLGRPKTPQPVRDDPAVFVNVPPDQLAYIDAEAARLSATVGQRIGRPAVIRMLIATAMAGKLRIK